MTAKQKALAWGMGILVWINVLSILLSAWQFGFVDWRTVAHMALIALPPLAVGTLLLSCFRVGAKGDRRVEAPWQARIPDTREAVRAGR